MKTEMTLDMPKSLFIPCQQRLLLTLVLAGALLMPVPVQAHFLWLVPAAGGNPQEQSVHMIFSERATEPEKDRLKLVEQAVVRQLLSKKPSDPLALSKSDKGWFVTPAPTPGTQFYTSQVFGVRSKGEKPFLLQYFAKSYVGTEHHLWTDAGRVPGWQLEAVPSLKGTVATLHCTWQEKPLAGAEVVVQLNDGTSIEGQSDEQGNYNYPIDTQKLIAARVKYVEARGGEFEGKPYGETRHYLTVTFENPTQVKEVANRGVSATSLYPDLPEGVTSFGGAVIDGALFVYGGNIGKSHDYFVGTQSNKLYRLKLQPGENWEVLSTSTPLQGTSMVAYGGKLYRVGGFNARNPQGEKKDLFSTSEFASYDPMTGAWTQLTPLPEPRSSHDIALMGDKLYVVGGWSMQGNAQTNVWHKTAWVYDFTKGSSSDWTEIVSPPSVRRGLTLAAHQGKLYAIGGMYEEGETTTETMIYDPQQQSWKGGPDLPGEEGDGFGASAFEGAGRLYVSGISGKLHRLSLDGQRWEEAKTMASKRFFHRMLPLDSGDLILVGGSNMKTGKVRELEFLSTAD